MRRSPRLGEGTQAAWEQSQAQVPQAVSGGPRPALRSWLLPELKDGGKGLWGPMVPGRGLVPDLNHQG